MPECLHRDLTRFSESGKAKQHSGLAPLSKHTQFAGWRNSWPNGIGCATGRCASGVNSALSFSPAQSAIVNDELPTAATRRVRLLDRLPGAVASRLGRARLSAVPEKNRIAPGFSRGGTSLLWRTSRVPSGAEALTYGLGSAQAETAPFQNLGM